MSPHTKNYMNTFIDWDPIQPRLLVGWLPQLYGMSGWLYWMTLFAASPAGHNDHLMALDEYAQVRGGGCLLGAVARVINNWYSSPSAGSTCDPTGNPCYC